MITVRYARYVVINEEKCSVVWSESIDGAQRVQKTHCGKLYDLDNDDPQTIEQALHNARQRMGVE